MKSKVYALMVLLAIIGCLTRQTEALMETTIIELLEEIRHRMCYPLLGLPAMDPFQVEHAKMNMNNKYVVDFSGSVTDLRVTGLSDFNVTDIKISTLPSKRSKFNIVLPLTALKSLYTAKGSLQYIVNLNGDGKAEGHIDDVKVSTSWIFKIGRTMGIKNLKIELSIGNLYADIESLIEEPRVNDFAHAVINELGIELLNDLWVEAQDRGVIQQAEYIINKILGNYTLTDIISIIGSIGGSGGDEPPFDGIPADCKSKIKSDN